VRVESTADSLVAFDLAAGMVEVEREEVEEREGRGGDLGRGQSDQWARGEGK
jgi:hypothetical protein